MGLLLASFEDAIDRADGEEYVRAEADTFLVERAGSRWEDHGEKGDEGIVEYERVVKRIVPHGEGWPDARATPYFQHQVFYAGLREYRARERNAVGWGDQIMYGEVVTSTNTILEKYRHPCPHLSRRGTAGG